MASIGGMAVNRAISGATTVASNCYAVVSYVPAGVTPSGSAGTAGSFSGSPIVTKYFGPGQTVPAFYNLEAGYIINSSNNVTATGTVLYNLSSGVEFISR
jgi:hypothetical protein